MSEEELQDPGASTQMFRAFVENYPEPEPSARRWIWPIVAAAVALVIAVAVLWSLAG
jgi:hypothetical protein